jgi:hypothetical protein
MATPLLRQFETTDPNTLEDLFLIMANNIERSLIQGGAIPGKDYSIHDLFTWATPFALEVFKKNDSMSFRTSF